MCKAVPGLGLRCSDRVVARVRWGVRIRGGVRRLAGANGRGEGFRLTKKRSFCYKTPVLLHLSLFSCIFTIQRQASDNVTSFAHSFSASIMIRTRHVPECRLKFLHRGDVISGVVKDAMAERDVMLLCPYICALALILLAAFASTSLG